MQYTAIFHSRKNENFLKKTGNVYRITAKTFIVCSHSNRRIRVPTIYALEQK